MNTLVTEEMLDAAVKKAVEAGLLPRHAGRDTQDYQELIRFVLQAALDAAAKTALMRRPGTQAMRYALRERFAEARDIVSG